MMNSEDTRDPERPGEPALADILASGAKGAIVLAGAATFIVAAIWLAFYLLVFLPRGGAA